MPQSLLDVRADINNVVHGYFFFVLFLFYWKYPSLNRVISDTASFCLQLAPHLPAAIQMKKLGMASDHATGTISPHRRQNETNSLCTFNRL